MASDLGFVGAGIQLAPNMARVLDRLGVWKEIEATAVDIKEASIRMGSTNEELGHVVMHSIKENYGYPHMTGHRSQLAGAMYKGCQAERAITFHFATKFDSVISWAPSPTFVVVPREGQPYTVECDILLGADGIKSPTRVAMLRDLGVSAEVMDTGQAAYRIMLTREQFAADPELLALIDKDQSTRWIGERKHIIAYPIANHTIYNISTAQPDDHFAAATNAMYTTRGSKSAMLAVYREFCPTVQKMLNMVPEGEVCEWKLRVHAALPTWVHGSTALVGDACHPTLPHLNQGAAQAIEDAGVLGVVLPKLPDTRPETINRVLRVYEAVRKERAETLVELAAQSGRVLHLGEGAAKAERDRAFKALREGKGPHPDKWADRDVQRMIYGFDCVGVAEEVFAERFEAM
ncbi:putative monooxygenase [Trichodelitschia bisporula]|uniref:Putative monooxygenase n=1 Tax=Trichodelitschia bisporula TaxID=703511 RepID=A0A6G1I634_9PEZI|nr:putative monooxygenase [Trichodelitschia bisporula]